MKKIVIRSICGIVLVLASFSLLIYNNNYTRKKLLHSFITNMLTTDFVRVDLKKVEIYDEGDRQSWHALEEQDQWFKQSCFDQNLIDKREDDICATQNTLRSAYKIRLHDLQLKFATHIIIIPVIDITVGWDNFLTNRAIHYTLYTKKVLYDGIKFPFYSQANGRIDASNRSALGDYLIFIKEDARYPDEIIKSLDISGRFLLDKRQLTLSDSIISINDKHNIDFTSQIGFHKDSTDINEFAVEYKLQDTPLLILKEFAPVDIKNFLDQHILDAVIKNSHGKIVLPPEFFTSRILLDEYIDINADIKNLIFSYDTLPILKDGDVALKGNATNLDLNILSLNLHNTQIIGTVQYSFGAIAPKVNIDAQADGPISDLLLFIDSEAYDDILRSGLTFSNLKATANSVAKVVIPIDEKEKNTYDIRTIANNVNGTIHPLLKLSKMQTTGVYDGEHLKIKVNGNVNNASATANININTSEVADSCNTDEHALYVTGDIKIDKNIDLAYLSPFIKIADGSTTLHLVYIGQEHGDTMSITGDLDKLAIMIPQMHFYKPAGVIAKMNIKANLYNIDHSKFNVILSTADKVNMEGAITIDKGTTTIDFPSLLYHGHKFGANITIDPLINIHARLYGERLNLGDINISDFFMNNKYQDNQKLNLKIDCSIDDVELKNSIHLTNFLLYINISNNIIHTAELNANIGTKLLRGELYSTPGMTIRTLQSTDPIWKTAKNSVKQIFTKVFITTPAKVEVTAKITDGYTYHWNFLSTNAGATIYAADITNKIKAGQLKIVGTTNVDNEGSIIDSDGIFTLHRFVSVKNEFLVRMLSTFSLAGLLDRFKQHDDSINFTESTGALYLKDGVLAISHALGQGPYFDFKIQSATINTITKTIEVRGATIPSLYGLTMPLRLLDRYGVVEILEGTNSKYGSAATGLLIIPFGAGSLVPLALIQLLVRPFEFTTKY